MNVNKNILFGNKVYEDIRMVIDIYQIFKNYLQNLKMYFDG